MVRNSGGGGQEAVEVTPDFTAARGDVSRIAETGMSTPDPAGSRPATVQAQSSIGRLGLPRGPARRFRTRRDPPAPHRGEERLQARARHQDRGAHSTKTRSGAAPERLADATGFGRRSRSGPRRSAASRRRQQWRGTAPARPQSDRGTQRTRPKLGSSAACLPARESDLPPTPPRGPAWPGRRAPAICRVRTGRAGRHRADASAPRGSRPDQAPPKPRACVHDPRQAPAEPRFQPSAGRAFAAASSRSWSAGSAP